MIYSGANGRDLGGPRRRRVRCWEGRNVEGGLGRENSWHAGGLQPRSNSNSEPRHGMIELPSQVGNKQEMTRQWTTRQEEAGRQRVVGLLHRQARP